MIRALIRPGGAREPVEVTLEQLEREDRRRWLVRLGDHHAEVTFEMSAPGVGRLEMGGRSWPFYVLQRETNVQVWIDGAIHRFERLDRSPARRSSPATEAALENDLTAPMPGTIRKINATVGQRFEAHQPLIIMESMKMELTLSAPRAGVVRQILCQEGQLVEMGAVLAELEKA